MKTNNLGHSRVLFKGVGGSIKLINLLVFMKKFTHFIRRSLPLLIGVFLVLGVWNSGTYNPHQELATLVPAAALATVDGLSGPALPPPPPLEGAVLRTCQVTASAPQVFTGASVTISWQTQGFDLVTLNGVLVIANGSQVFTNLQENTSYTIIARTTDGKHECVQTVTVVCVPPPPPSCVLTPSEVTINSGETVTLSWTTTNASSTTLTSFGTVPNNGSRTTPPLTNSTTYTLNVLGLNGSSVSCQSQITVKIPPPPAHPTCTLTPTSATITQGNSVTLQWSTTNAVSATLTSFGSVPLSGNRNVTPTVSTTYTLSVLGQNGSTVTCPSHITVVPPEPKVCDLQLIKSVSSPTAVPGDTLTYTIKIKNIGTGDCTGSGVKIVDVHDSQLTFVSATQSSNILPGYIDEPLYTPSTRTLTWNGDVLVPGEEGTMSFTAKVKSLSCGKTRVVKNTAKATALELNHFLTWRSSNVVETLVTAPACPIPPPVCDLTPATRTINSGETVTLSWTTTNASSTTLTSFGTVPNNGSRTTPPLTNSTTYTLSVLGLDGSTVTCLSKITVKETPPPTPVPVCKSFTANPTSINRGATSTIAWVTENTTRVTIDNGIGQVVATGTLSVAPLTTTTYTLKAYRQGVDGAADQEVTCQATVSVVQPPPPTPAPICKSFTASPTSLPAGGGSTKLTWATENATTASISGIGSVAVNGSTTVSVSTSTTYTLTVLGTDNQEVKCNTTVTVATPPPPVALTCAANVTLNLSPTSVVRGGASTLTWNTTGVESVSFDNGITATGTSGSVTVAPTTNTTYTLTATTASSSVQCPVTLTVTNPPSGGGGGGSSTPTCELSISANRVSRGESATLRWNSSRASDLVLTDSHGATLADTRNLLAGEKDRLFSGSLRVTPTRDTVYTVRVIRGTTDRTCTARVTVDNPILVTEVRDQQPLVAGIALIDVPYTGFEAGPILTFLFYLILMLWALYLAYVLVIKRDVLGGYRLANEHIVAEAPTSEEIRPDVFVKSVQVPPTPPLAVLPPDLPTGEPVIGYRSLMTAAAVAHDAPVVTHTSHQADEAEITALENQAHARHALLSSDAVRHLIGTTETEGRAEALDEVIKLAKAKFPAEDGWVVINEERMRELCLACQAKPMQSTTAPYIPATVPAGAGSLAEAIVTGNVLAAYAMIGHRPMFALADAAADLDALYRLRRGESATVSNLLQASTTALSDAQIEAMITALTGALDGTYTDEASAVKMSIMKAIKVLG